MIKSRLKIETPCGVVLVAPIDELELLQSKATAEELKSVEGISAPSRRRERLAWRILLREFLAETEAETSDHHIEYTPSGAPQIICSNFSHISVSHSRTHVAVMLSNKPCGVDIENRNRDFERVASRYINSEECQLSYEEWWLSAIWAAKEALYKMAQREGVDLRRDLRIINFDATTCNISATIFDEQKHLLKVMAIEDQILVYTL